MKLLANKQSEYLLILLVAADLAFIAIGIVYECGFLNLMDICQAVSSNSYYALTTDRSYSEFFQYIKEYWLIILFFLLAIEQNFKIYIGWCLLSIYILLDDAFQIHENVGLTIANKFNFIYAFNLRPEDYGELIVFATVGTFFFLWLSFGYRLGNKRERKIIRNLIAILLGLAAFGVFADVVHIWFEKYPFLKSAIGIIEDGGEHLVMSLFVYYVMSVMTGAQKKTGKSIENYILPP